MSTPTSLILPDGVRRTAIETSRGAFAALEAMPGSRVCERQPAILVPGFTGSKEDFLAILQQLAAAGRRVLALDMRGQYETSGPDDPGAYTIAELGFDIAAVIDAVAARATAAAPGDDADRGLVHLVGHSFGGLVVRESVLAGASGIGSLTFMSSGPGRITGQAAADLARLTASLDGSPEVMRRTIRHIWDTTFAPQATAAGIAPEIVAFLRERMLRNSPVGLLVMGQYLLTAPDRTAELARVRRRAGPRAVRRGRRQVGTGRAGRDGGQAERRTGVHPGRGALPRRRRAGDDRQRAQRVLARGRGRRGRARPGGPGRR